MPDDFEDGPPHERDTIEPPPVEAGTEASPAPPFPRNPPPGRVGLETILTAIHELRDDFSGQVGRVGEDVAKLIPEVRTLGSRVSGMENAIDKRRQRDEANQETMRNQIQNLCSEVATTRKEVVDRFANLEDRMTSVERRLDAVEDRQSNGGQ